MIRKNDLTIGDLLLEMAVFCEDIREEKSGKFTLVGVFGGDIIVPSFPATVRAAFFLAVRSNLEGDRILRVRLMLNGVQLGEATSAVKFVPNAMVGQIIIPPGLFNAADPGAISVEMSDDGTNWTDVITKKLMAGTLPT